MQDHVGLGKEEFYVAGSGRPRIFYFCGNSGREKSRTHLFDKNSLKRFGLLRLPNCRCSLGEKRVAQTNCEHREGILGRTGGRCV